MRILACLTLTISSCLADRETLWPEGTLAVHADGAGRAEVVVGRFESDAGIHHRRWGPGAGPLLADLEPGSWVVHLAACRSGLVFAETAFEIVVGRGAEVAATMQASAPRPCGTWR